MILALSELRLVSPVTTLRSALVEDVDVALDFTVFKGSCPSLDLRLRLCWPRKSFREGVHGPAAPLEAVEVRPRPLLARDVARSLS